MVAVTLGQFEEMMERAVEALPAYFRDRLDNVAILVEDLADPATLRAAGLGNPYDLLGFYHGVPLTLRTTDYGLVAPDKISIYRKPILRQCATEEEVRSLVARVVRHELAHYFGLDDDRLEELGAY